MKILKSLIFISLTTTFSQLNIISTNTGILSTKGNKVGLTARDICYIVPENSVTGETTINIQCNSGRKFENVCAEIQSATGTPPWILRKGYIGQIKEPTPKGGLPGSGKRTSYYVCRVQASAD